MTEELRTEIGKEFTIALDANPTTGYSWEASFDQELVSLVRREHRPSSDLIGAGGQPTFVFRPLKQGSGTIELRYRRPWEPEAVETRIFTVVVD